jgi:ATP-dependent RNA circularization protein (DNA/RNA ligase family)
MVERITPSFSLHKEIMIIVRNKTICPFTIRKTSYYMSLELEPKA